jgi:hypothetical protein
MRHSDPKLTANIYTDLDEADLHAAVSTMPSVVPKVAAKVAVTGGTLCQFESTTVHSCQDGDQGKAST